MRLYRLLIVGLGFVLLACVVGRVHALNADGIEYCSRVGRTAICNSWDPATTRLGDAVGQVSVTNADGSHFHMIVNTGAFRDCPSGWTCPSNAEATPPATDPASTVYGISGCTLNKATAGDAIAEWFGSCGGTSSGWFLCNQDATGFNAGYPSGCGTVNNNRVNFNLSYACNKAGYGTLSGTTCNLDNASAVMKTADGTCQVVRVGNVFQNDVQDPDCNLSDPTSAASKALLGGAGTATVTEGIAGRGVSCVANTDGTTTCTVSLPSGSGNTINSGTKIGAPGSGGQGVIEGTSTGTTVGTGSLGSSTAAGQDNCGAPGQAECSVKVDEAGVAAVSSNLTAANSALDAAATSRIAQLSTSTGVTSLGLGITIPWPSDSCVDPSFAMPGGHGNLVVPMCARRADLQSALNWYVQILTALALFAIGVSAFRGS